MTEVFFSSSDIVSAGRLRHLVRTAPRGMHHGGNASGRSGTSPDFSDFQPYAPGDDIRKVDWNIYARTDQLFIKQFMDERELCVSVILDASRSMNGARWLFARRLCGMLGLMALSGDDHFHFFTAGGSVPSVFSVKGIRNRHRFLDHLEQLPSPAGAGFAEAAVPKSLPGASVRYIVTDGLEPPASFRPLFRKLGKSAGEVRMILLRQERPDIPDRAGDVRFIDSETGKAVDVALTANTISRQRELREQHFSELAAISREYGIAVLEAEEQEGAAAFVLRKMRKAGWVR